MGSANILHLHAQSPIVNGPDATTICSATTPNFGRLTTSLLDPAGAPAGGTQYKAEISTLLWGAGIKTFIVGRWITRPLPAQTIAAGNWTFYGATNGMNAAGTSHCFLWGFCVAQWRAGTGVVARFADFPNGGTDVVSLAAQDAASATTQAGGALTLLANDQIVLEVWTHADTTSGTGSYNANVLLNGQGQYVAGMYTLGQLTDTDAYLKAPQAIVFA